MSGSQILQSEQTPHKWAAENKYISKNLRNIKVYREDRRGLENEIIMLSVGADNTSY